MFLRRSTPRAYKLSPLDVLIDDLFFGNFDESFTPENRTRVQKTDTGYQIDIQVPGFSEDQISIDLDSGYLNVKAEQSDDSWTSSFSKSWKLPQGTDQDQIQASLKNGILSVEIPSGEKVLKKVPILVNQDKEGKALPS
jgi:HSP20 family protein